MTEKQDRKNKYDQRLKIITYDIAIRVLLEVVFLVFASHLTFTMLSPTLFTPPPHFHKSYGMPGNFYCSMYRDDTVAYNFKLDSSQSPTRLFN